MNDINRIVLFTGSTGGIGEVVCEFLLNNNYTIIAPIRNIKKGENLKISLKNKLKQSNLVNKLIFYECNFLSIKSINNTILSIKSYLDLKNSKLDIIIHNAGIISNSYVITEDGFESSIQTNYISGKLFIDNLIGYIKNNGKIINTLSLTAMYGKKLNKKYNRLNYYSHSKYLLYNYTKELQHNYKNLLVCGIDPGIVNTGIITMHKWFDPLADILFRPFIKSPYQGAIPIINAINYQGCNNKGPYLFKSNKILYLK